MQIHVPTEEDGTQDLRLMKDCPRGGRTHINVRHLMKSILVTGSAGFIGANLVKRLFTEMNEGTIIGLDNLNNYYDVSLKEYRLQELDTYYSQLTNSPQTLNSQLSTISLSRVQ